MAFILVFNVALQMLAAFVIFLFGYLALLVSLMICFLIVIVISVLSQESLSSAL